MSPPERARAQPIGRSAYPRPQSPWGAALLVVTEGSRSLRTPQTSERGARRWLARNLPRVLISSSAFEFTVVA